MLLANPCASDHGGESTLSRIGTSEIVLGVSTTPVVPVDIDGYRSLTTLWIKQIVTQRTRMLQWVLWPLKRHAVYCT